MVFQSHLGSIQTPGAGGNSLFDPDVSIPPWFDSNGGGVIPCSAIFNVSIPPWFDSNETAKKSTYARTSVSIPPWFDSNLLLLSWFRGIYQGFNPTLVRFKPANGTASGQP